MHFVFDYPMQVALEKMFENDGHIHVDYHGVGAEANNAPSLTPAVKMFS